MFSVELISGYSSIFNKNILINIFCEGCFVVTTCAEQDEDYDIATEHCNLQPKVEIFLQSLICIFWANKELCVIILFVFVYSTDTCPFTKQSALSNIILYDLILKKNTK